MFQTLLMHIKQGIPYWLEVTVSFLIITIALSFIFLLQIIYVLAWTKSSQILPAAYALFHNVRRDFLRSWIHRKCLSESITSLRFLLLKQSYSQTKSLQDYGRKCYGNQDIKWDSISFLVFKTVFNKIILYLSEWVIQNQGQFL